MSEFILPQFDPTKYYYGKLCKRRHVHALIGYPASMRVIRKGGGSCVECKYINHREHYLANVEKYAAHGKANREANLARHNERNRLWAQRNPESRARSCKKWQQENKERCTDNALRWQKANPEKVSESGRKYRRTEKGKLLVKELSRLNRARRRNVITGTIDLKLIYDHFNNECCYCGSTELLQLEHLQPISKGGDHIMSNLAIACRSCNSSKRNKTLNEYFNCAEHFTVERRLVIRKWQLYCQQEYK